MAGSHLCVIPCLASFLQPCKLTQADMTSCSSFRLTAVYSLFQEISIYWCSQLVMDFWGSFQFFSAVMNTFIHVCQYTWARASPGLDKEVESLHCGECTHLFHFKMSVFQGVCTNGLSYLQRIWLDWPAWGWAPGVFRVPGDPINSS